MPDLVKIDFNEIPKVDIDIGCSVINMAVKRMFQDPKEREKYERWMAKGGYDKFRTDAEKVCG